VCSSPGRRPTCSENPEKILGESRPRRKILAGISGQFWEFLGILRHRSQVHQSQVTKGAQPRARVNVSCSRAGHKRGDRGTTKKRREGRVGTTNRGRGRLGTGPGQKAARRQNFRKFWGPSDILTSIGSEFCGSITRHCSRVHRSQNKRDLCYVSQPRAGILLHHHRAWKTEWGALEDREGGRGKIKKGK
jgi:hypothetical protein